MSEQMSDSSIICLCHGLFNQPHRKSKQRGTHTFIRTKTNVQKNAKAHFLKLSFRPTDTLQSLWSCLSKNHQLFYESSSKPQSQRHWESHQEILSAAAAVKQTERKMWGGRADGGEQRQGRTWERQGWKINNQKEWRREYVVCHENAKALLILIEFHAISRVLQPEEHYDTKHKMKTQKFCQPSAIKRRKKERSNEMWRNNFDGKRKGRAKTLGSGEWIRCHWKCKRRWVGVREELQECLGW